MTHSSLCFCDLAPFHALDLLSEEECAWVNEQAAQDADLALELESFQTAAATLAYGAPDIAPSHQLKTRLFEQIGEPLAQESTPPEPSDLWAMQAKDLSWRSHVVPGVEVAVMHRDKQTRTVVGLLRVEPGVRYPLHRHAGVEEIYMLRGDLQVNQTTYGPGDYLRSAPGSSHDPITRSGCEFFFRASLEDEFLEVVSTAR